MYPHFIFHVGLCPSYSTEVRNSWYLSIQAAKEMLYEYYEMLPEQHEITSCTQVPISLTHLCQWDCGVYFEHSHYSALRAAMELYFSHDICQTTGMLADKLSLKLKNEQMLEFLAPTSEFTMKRAWYCYNKESTLTTEATNKLESWKKDIQKSVSPIKIPSERP